jgi:tetratricopeptide (TPR) repeat protein
MYRGSYLGSLGRYDLSHRLLGEAEAAAHDAHELELQAEAHLRHALLFFLQKDYTASGRMFRAVLRLAEQIGGWYFRGNALCGIGKNLMIQEHYRDAMPWLEESVRIFEGAGARLSIAMVWSELAVCYLGIGDDERALKLFRDAERINQESGFVHNHQVVLANIGNVYLYRREYFTALSYYPTRSGTGPRDQGSGVTEEVDL